MSGYKWQPGDWFKLSPDGVTAYQVQSAAHALDVALSASATPVTVRPKPAPKKIKRSELHAWFERQTDAYIVARNAGAQWHVRGSNRDGVGRTLETAILALRKALKKAGKFTP